MASASGDRTLKLWNVHTGECFQTLTGHTHRVRSVVFSPDGTQLASGSDDHTVRLWDVTNIRGGSLRVGKRSGTPKHN